MTTVDDLEPLKANWTAGRMAALKAAMRVDWKDYKSVVLRELQMAQ